MDLIIGLPEEDIDDVRSTMEQVRELAPDSVTVHSLAIKRAARLNIFKERYANLKIQNTQEMIDLTAKYAREMGLEPYYLYRQKNMAGNFENAMRHPEKHVSTISSSWRKSRPSWPAVPEPPRKSRSRRKTVWNARRM